MYSSNKIQDTIGMYKVDEKRLWFIYNKQHDQSYCKAILNLLLLVLPFFLFDAKLN